MEGQVNICAYGALDDSNYSSPMPLIGLYIAAATLVCLLFIFLDIFAGFRDRKRWLPCRFFSLNSVTLTLLSIAVKLPVDLTSPMPGVQDQLSKLTGTALICNSMGFFMPSLGMNTNSECFTNMIALSILAVTVVVNICIQLHTGVIFLFRVQHILILCSMIILLMTLWFCSLYVHNEKEASTDGIKDCLTNGRKSMFYRLQMCYLYSYSSDPQFHMIYKTVFNVFVSMICTLCSVVLIRSAVSLVPEDLKPCAYGVSDYKWSMSIIVVSQLVTLIVAGLGVFLRFFTWFILLPSRDFKAYQEEVKDADYVILRNPILRSGIQDSCVTVTKIVMNFIIKLIPFLVMFPYAVVLSLTDECFKKKVRHEEDIEKFKDLIQNEKRGLDKWTLREGVKDMKRWIEGNKPKSLNRLKEVLSKSPPSASQESLAQLLRKFYDSKRTGYEMSTLSLVLVARIADISIPYSLSGSLLLSSLSEVFQVIQFVDRKMSPSTFENKKKTKLAEALLNSDKFNSHLLPKIMKKFKMKTSECESESDSQLAQAIEIIRGLKGELPTDYVRKELAIITEFILSCRAHGSVEELYGCLEQLFVHLSIEYLIELPNAIFKEIVECHPEECEKRIKSVLKILGKIEELEGVVPWSFPEGTTISHLISDEGKSFMTAAGSIHGIGKDCGNDQSDSKTTRDEIIQVE
ncbi:hypothetical protein Syun_030671 [Stephania yunnanensis]|uniref:Uncharacterized protein n=1 Tax=Stephania yunnanensis TaxID=152371 RepID=A0AAP0E236_9MAGN